jgi:hypothetical protein
MKSAPIQLALKVLGLLFAMKEASCATIVQIQQKGRVSALDFTFQ